MLYVRKYLDLRALRDKKNIQQKQKNAEHYLKSFVFEKCNESTNPTRTQYLYETH